MCRITELFVTMFSILLLLSDHVCDIEGPLEVDLFLSLFSVATETLKSSKGIWHKHVSSQIRLRMSH